MSRRTSVRARRSLRLLRSAGAVLVGLCLAASSLASVVRVPEGNAPNLSLRLQAPFWLGGQGDFILGSDQLGREILYRLLSGLRTSLLIGALAATIAGAIGTLLGLIAGYTGGVLDTFVMRVVDVQALVSVPGACHRHRRRART